MSDTKEGNCLIPLYKPFTPELPELDTILCSGALAYGDYTKKFEERLRDYFGTPYLITTANFHLAISVALMTIGMKSGDAIIASPMACLASTQPYLSYGLSIDWADIDSTTGTLLPESVRKRISKNIKAIIHNHFCGYPGYIEEINAIGKEYGIPVIDDGIECFGAEYHGMKIGNCGTDVTVFSLSAVRFCNCIEGGVVIFKDKKLYEKSLLIRDCGIDRTRFRDELGEINPKYDISLVGYSATMSNVNGYIGLRQMDEVENLLVKHRLQADKWSRFFEEENDFLPLYQKECNPNYWVYGLLVNDKVEAIKKFREMGYYASGVHIRNDMYSAFGKQDVVLPGVDDFSKRFIALPCGWWME